LRKMTYKDKASYGSLPHCICLSIYISIYVYEYVRMCVCICMYVSIYLSISLNILYTVYDLHIPFSTGGVESYDAYLLMSFSAKEPYK